MLLATLVKTVMRLFLGSRLSKLKPLQWKNFTLKPVTFSSKNLGQFMWLSELSLRCGRQSLPPAIGLSLLAELLLNLRACKSVFRSRSLARRYAIHDW